MRNKSKSNAIVFLLIIISAIALLFMRSEVRYVAAPILGCVIMFLWLWMTVWEWDKSMPFFDIGIFCALATLLYTIYPLINYWADGLQFGPLSDGRLQSFGIQPNELALFHLRHVIYLFALVITYVAFRGRGLIRIGNLKETRRSMAPVVIAIFLILTGYFVILQLTTGVSFTPSYSSDEYAKYLSALAGLPYTLLQISFKLAGILFVFKLAVLLLVINRCSQKKWRIILVVWIAAEIGQTIFIRGARTNLVLFLMATILLYHRMIKPLSLKALLAMGAILLAGFIFLGQYRSYYGIEDLQADISLNRSAVFSSNNEFQALLGTEYDVYLRKKAGVELPWYLYINDVIDVLPPKQLMPFEKITAAEGYLRERGLSGTGVGLMWGVISQSIIGLDWLELAIRGALLGYIMARFHKWYLKHQKGVIETLVYMYFCLKAYYTFRSTTFSFLMNFVWEIVPFYILIRLGMSTLSSKVGFGLGQDISHYSHKVK